MTILIPGKTRTPNVSRKRDIDENIRKMAGASFIGYWRYEYQNFRGRGGDGGGNLLLCDQRQRPGGSLRPFGRKRRSNPVPGKIKRQQREKGIKSREETFFPTEHKMTVYSEKGQGEPYDSNGTDGGPAKEAARKLAVAGSQKDVALEAIAQALTRHCDKILEANRIDLPEQGEKNGLTASLLDRLALTKQRIQGMANGVRQVKALPDPIGQVLEGGVRPNGLSITKVRVPLGGDRHHL